MPIPNEMTFIAGMELMQYHINALAKEKGFWDKPFNYGEKIALIIEELSDALKAVRETPTDIVAPDRHLPQYTREEVKLADCVIRVLDLAAHRRIPLGKVLIDKYTFNKSRPRLHDKNF